MLNIGPEILYKGSRYNDSPTPLFLQYSNIVSQLRNEYLFRFHSLYLVCHYWFLVTKVFNSDIRICVDLFPLLFHNCEIITVYIYSIQISQFLLVFHHWLLLFKYYIQISEWVWTCFHYFSQLSNYSFRVFTRFPLLVVDM